MIYFLEVINHSERIQYQIISYPNRNDLDATDTSHDTVPYDYHTLGRKDPEFILD